MNFPKGFTAHGLEVEEKVKLALFYSKVPARAVALFTRNQLAAAPVKVSKKHLAFPWHQAIVINAGNANACTGKRGLKDAQEICQLVGKKLRIRKENVLIASTGIIGQYLPMDKIRWGIKKIFSTPFSFLKASKMILTTDTHLKVASESFTWQGKKVNLWGCAKGAGMIYPRLATMLAVLLTDLNIKKSLLKKALKKAAENSFQALTVEGDTSTNDTVFLLANGESRNEEIKSEKSLGYQLFLRRLERICQSLAEMIAVDGEGATKHLQILVRKAKTPAQAEEIAFRIAHSPLIKTAFFGESPNWGRIMASIGAVNSKIDPQKVELRLGDFLVFKKGEIYPQEKRKLKKLLKKKKIEIKVNLNLGRAEKKVNTCDLSYEYIKVNIS